MPRRSRRRQLELQAKIVECTINWICFLPLFSLGTLIGFCMPTHNPKFYIQEFYVPALHISPDNPYSNITRTSRTIFFDLKLQNSMDYRGVRYHSVNLTFFYIPVNTTSTITNNNGTAPAPPAPPLLLANYTVPGFYQGYGNAAMRRDVVVTPHEGQLPWWDEAIRAVSGGSTVVFRVDLAASMKFKYMASYAWRRKVKDIGAIVEVDGSGRKVHKDAAQFISPRTKT